MFTDGQTDRQTDNGCRTIAISSWNELKMKTDNTIQGNNTEYATNKSWRSY